MLCSSHPLAGGGSTIWNLLIKLFKGTLKRTIASKIAAAASTQLNAVLAGVMQKYPLFVPLAGELLNTTQLNLPLVATTGPAGAGVPAPFAVANDYLIGGGNFFFSSTVNTTVDTRAHSPISNDMPVSPAGTPSMFGMAMSEQLLGSLLFTLTLNGKLEWHGQSGTGMGRNVGRVGGLRVSCALLVAHLFLFLFVRAVSYSHRHPQWTTTPSHRTRPSCSTLI